VNLSVEAALPSLQIGVLILDSAIWVLNVQHLKWIARLWLVALIQLQTLTRLALNVAFSENPLRIFLVLVLPLCQEVIQQQTLRDSSFIFGPILAFFLLLFFLHPVRDASLALVDEPVCWHLQAFLVAGFHPLILKSLILQLELAHVQSLLIFLKLVLAPRDIVVLRFTSFEFAKLHSLKVTFFVSFCFLGHFCWFDLVSKEPWLDQASIEFLGALSILIVPKSALWRGND